RDRGSGGDAAPGGLRPRLPAALVARARSEDPVQDGADSVSQREGVLSRRRAQQARADQSRRRERMTTANDSLNVFICSAGHSGSTLLDMLLGTHSRAESLGELVNLPLDIEL